MYLGSMKIAGVIMWEMPTNHYFFKKHEYIYDIEFPK